jgi:NADPH2:quinone reductase
LLPLLTGVGRAHHGAILREAARLAESGQLMPRLDPHSFSLAEVEAAHQLVAERKAAGKVVVSVG